MDGRPRTHPAYRLDDKRGDRLSTMTKRHCERKGVGYREPKSSQKLVIPDPPMLSTKRTVGIPTAGTAGSGTLSIAYHFAITQHRS
jgi:hypothetical protein